MVIRPDLETFEAALWEGDLRIAETSLNNSFCEECSFELARGLVPSPVPHVVMWQVESRSRAILHLPESMFVPKTNVARRLFNTMPLLARYHASGAPECGRLAVNLDDAGLIPGLAYCANRSAFFLIPDEVFLGTRGYKDLRDHYEIRSVPWKDRVPVAFWRGGNSGHSRRGWRGLPRIMMCQLCSEFPAMFDVGISHAVPADLAEPLKEGGLMREYVPLSEFTKYRYQIDIDGNSSAWASLFSKLLTGSPVLKIASPFGHRQWYYDRLRPWLNYVPVDSDMSDLVAKVRWLRDHDEAARAIGEQGQALALSLDYDGELKRAVFTVTAALRYFALRSESNLHFGRGERDNGVLREGWFDPVDAGVAARGFESRIELPRPITPGDFVLALDVSFRRDVPRRLAQRLTIAVNGEVLRHVVLTERRTVECSLPRQTIEAGDVMTITLLHPDAAVAATEANVLDTRVVSIMIHGIALTPASVYATNGRIAPATALAPLPALETDDGGDITWLYGPDIWLPPQTEPQPILTYHGTFIFADIADCRLRHGSPTFSPHNVFLAVSGGNAYLLHIAGDGNRYSIRIPKEWHDLPAEPIASASEGWLQVFHIVDTGTTDEGSFSLSHDGLFLCAELDGRVTLSRKSIGIWERFRINEPRDTLVRPPLAHTPPVPTGTGEGA
jgi:hypothetical protein